MARAVFGDAAGTLFETSEPAGYIYARIARKYGLAADDAKVNAGFRRAFSSAPGPAFGPDHTAGELRWLEREWWRGLVRETFRGLGDFGAGFDAFFDELFAYFAEPAHWKLIPGATSVLRDLKKSGTRLGVISNFDYRVYAIIDGLGLAPYFDSMTISSEAGFAKPAKEIFIAALARTGVSAREAVHVGDSERLDVPGAEAAGLAVILVDSALQGGEIVRGRSARVVSLASIVRVVQLLLAV
jgi:putative hydrolase of the HAD superfamily